MNTAAETPAGFAPVLSGEAFAAQAALWTLPSFDEALRRQAEPPPPPPPPPPSAAQLEAIEAAAAREGQERGYAEGYAQGRAEGAAEVAAESTRLRELLQHLANPLAEIDNRTEQALVALMLELARRLVQQELVADPVKMLGVVRDAVAHIAQPVRGLRIRLNPEDAGIVADHLQTETANEGWQIVPDRQLMPGDCVVETDSARVDARLDTRQAQLAQRLLGEGA